MDVKATLQEKTSKKGNSYICIEIQLTDTFKKVIFLEGAEIELAKQVLSKNDMPEEWR